MLQKLKLILYYIIIQHLPHSRLLKFCNTIRVRYIANILKIMPYDKRSKIEPNIYLSNAIGTKIGYNCRINENVLFNRLLLKIMYL